MAYENVSLWFAEDINKNIITINEISESNKHSQYHCPLCNSSVIPKAIKEDAIITPHFAHVDKSKCNNETMIHFWFKHKFIMPGDKFTVRTNTLKNFICKEIYVEKLYYTSYGDYKPDLTIITECGETVYFEMDYSSKKKVEDYIDKWLELGNIVVEVDIKSLVNTYNNLEFKALFYKGKCLNTKKNDLYYNTIGQYKERIFRENDHNSEIKERVKKLDWFWRDVNRYTKGEVNIDYMIDLIDIIDEKEDRKIVKEILNKPKCNNLLRDYLTKKVDDIYKTIYKHYRDKIGETFDDYIKSYVGHSGYYYHEGLRGQINILDVSDNCFCIYDVDEYDKKHIINQCKSYLEKAIKHNKNKEIINIYNKNSEIITEKITNNSIYKSYLTHMQKDKKNYNITLDVMKIHCKPLDFSSDHIPTIYNVNFRLIYKEHYNVAEEYNIEIKLDDDISNLCNIMIDKFNSYFTNLSYLRNVELLECIVQQLGYELKDCNITITGSLMFEDIYKIFVKMNDRYLDTYYISNKGILSSWGIGTTSRGSKMDLETNNLKEIKNHILKNIYIKIKEETTYNCIECGIKFNLEIGEIKFFNKKKFNYPRRCKSCRESRKQRCY